MAEKPTLWNLIKAGMKDVGMPFEWDSEKGGFQRQDLSGRYIDVKHSLDPGMPNIMNYINELDFEDPETVDFFKYYARRVASDQESAWQGQPTLDALDNILFGMFGGYSGQNLVLLEKAQKQSNPEAWIKASSEFWGVREPINLRDIFLGYISAEDEGLEETHLRPGGTVENWDKKRYPFKNEGKKVYDVAPYISIQSITSYETREKHEDLASRNKYLKEKANNLKKGEGFKIETPMMQTTLDFGRSNWSIGKDEYGRIYAAIADIWDFGGTAGGPLGEIVDKIGEPINMYGRIYLTPEHFEYDEVLALEDIFPDFEFDEFGRPDLKDDGLEE